MDMDHSGLLEKQGNLNLSRRLSRDGDRIGTGERSGVGTTQASGARGRQPFVARLNHPNGDEDVRDFGGAHLVLWPAVVSPPSPQRKRRFLCGDGGETTAGHRTRWAPPKSRTSSSPFG